MIAHCDGIDSRGAGVLAYGGGLTAGGTCTLAYGGGVIVLRSGAIAHGGGSEAGAYGVWQAGVGEGAGVVGGFEHRDEKNVPADLGVQPARPARVGKIGRDVGIALDQVAVRQGGAAVELLELVRPESVLPDFHVQVVRPARIREVRRDVGVFRDVGGPVVGAFPGLVRPRRGQAEAGQAEQEEQGGPASGGGPYAGATGPHIGRPSPPGSAGLSRCFESRPLRVPGRAPGDAGGGSVRRRPPHPMVSGGA